MDRAGTIDPRNLSSMYGYVQDLILVAIDLYHHRVQLKLVVELSP